MFLFPVIIVGAGAADPVITCQAGGEAISSATWYRYSVDRPRELIVGDSDKFIIESNNRLTIRNVMAEDEGVYECNYMQIDGDTGMEDAGCIVVLGKHVDVDACVYPIT